MTDKNKAIPTAILGASGYTGAELVRILASHPAAELKVLTAERRAGKEVAEVHPHLGGLDLPLLTATADADLSGVAAVFACLPHGASQEIIAALPDHLKIIDLSADFRLADTQTYAQWYGRDHGAPELQQEAVYGLSEVAREAVKTARLVANPGCYPTASLLPLVPLLKAGLIDSDGIIIDAKSGVSGAGRALKESNLFCEVSESFAAYGVAAHRHAPEIEQGLSVAAGSPVGATFTPHLVPMNRGIFATIYVRLAGGADADGLRSELAAFYGDAPFVQVLEEGALPATRHVRGSNACHMSVFDDRRPGGAILLSVIDNLVKGASGQAVQNFNLMFGLDETAGLGGLALAP
ncbi:MAG: N-acetyl-gamma-glutamyl-phosphate reductase [Alphaproteobacteria bacterium]|nr:N-acetyl-gamma-glutamyl-phosphate reductase [Alphaproteobacteria bacterium]